MWAAVTSTPIRLYLSNETKYLRFAMHDRFQLLDQSFLSIYVNLAFIPFSKKSIWRKSVKYKWCLFDRRTSWYHFVMSKGALNLGNLVISTTSHYLHHVTRPFDIFKATHTTSRNPRTSTIFWIITTGHTGPYALTHPLLSEMLVSIGVIFQRNMCLLFFWIQ